MKKQLDIEWRHFEKNGDTCERCSTTGDAIAAAIAELRECCGAECCGEDQVQITFKETTLNVGDIKESNQVLINGQPLEGWLPNATVGESHCGSCSDLVEEETSCRTVQVEGETYEAIPSRLIKQAACSILQCC